MASTTDSTAGGGSKSDLPARHTLRTSKQWLAITAVAPLAEASFS